MKLSNKVALITGGTSGIGLEAAKLFRDEGARVIVTGADQTRLDAASRQLGSDVLALRCDVRIPAELDDVFDGIRQGSIASTSFSRTRASGWPRHWNW